jgi:hypothetical protein
MASEQLLYRQFYSLQKTISSGVVANAQLEKFIVRSSCYNNKEEMGGWVGSETLRAAAGVVLRVNTNSRKLELWLCQL